MRRTGVWTVFVALLSLSSCARRTEPSPHAAGGLDTGTSGSTRDGESNDEASPGARAGPRWQPRRGTSWQWQLSGKVRTSYDVAMYDIDLFETPQETIDALHAAGRIVICYFSAGSREAFREDADRFTPTDHKKKLEGWPGESWLDIRSKNVRDVMRVRLDQAVKKRCDGVEPDNVDGYQNNTGFALTEADQLDYNRFLADEAHRRGLSVGLKNALDLARALEPRFDWALNEQCLAQGECAKLAPFLKANKPVFHVEYVDRAVNGPAKLAAICKRPEIKDFSTLVKTAELGPERFSCW